MRFRKQAPSDGLTKRRYDTILSKLFATVSQHKAAFPQLAAIPAFVDSSFTAPVSDGDCLEKLEALCHYLQEAGVNCYIFRHLHYNVCLDVEAVKNHTSPFNLADSYIILPK